MESGDFHLAALVQLHFAEALLNQGDVQKAKKSFYKALPALIEMGVPENMQAANELKRLLDAS
jgi:hypothetical protein